MMPLDTERTINGLDLNPHGQLSLLEHFDAYASHPAISALQYTANWESLIEYKP
jgi:hypothetical protein